MAQVLYITANPKKSVKSFGIRIGQKFLEAYQSVNPGDEIIFIDLFNSDIPQMDEALLDVIENLKKGMPSEQLTEHDRSRFERYNQLTDQFVAADKYVFVTPLWNLGLPARVKDYIDTICVAGKTFKYTEKGPQGLLKNKKCLHIHASGGFHSQDPFNHADPYLRDIMNFIGIKDYKTILIEGHGAIPDKAENMLQEVYGQIPDFVKWFS